MYNQAFAAHSGFGAFAPRGGCGGRGRHWGGPAGGRRGIPPWARFFEGSWASAPVNIEETPERFVLTLYAAGLRKESIQLTVQGDVLTIAYPGAAAEAPAETGRFTRREFRDPSFERTFRLSGKVAIDGIGARYADGVLTVTLPKTPEAQQPPQPIAVA